MMMLLFSCIVIVIGLVGLGFFFLFLLCLLWFFNFVIFLLLFFVLLIMFFLLFVWKLLFGVLFGKVFGRDIDDDVWIVKSEVVIVVWVWRVEMGCGEVWVRSLLDGVVRRRVGREGEVEVWRKEVRCLVRRRGGLDCDIVMVVCEVIENVCVVGLLRMEVMFGGFLWLEWLLMDVFVVMFEFFELCRVWIEVVVGCGGCWWGFGEVEWGMGWCGRLGLGMVGWVEVGIFMRIIDERYFECWDLIREYCSLLWF